MTYWICLSSDAQRRYRDDILRALSLPIGARLQFRYRTELVSDAALARIRKGDLQGQVAILHFLDRETVPTSIPCRAATLVAGKEVGRWVVLTLTVGNYAHARDLVKWNDALAAAARSAKAEPVHGDPGPVSADIQGHYCYTVNSAELPEDVCGFRTDDYAETWQEVVTQLAGRRGFREIWTFFRVEGFEPQVQFLDGVALLSPDTNYTLRIQHYHPEDREFATAVLEVKSTNAVLSFLDGRRLVDSPYDEKAIRFRTARPLEAEAGTIYVEFSRLGASPAGAPEKEGASSLQPDGGSRTVIAPPFPSEDGESLFDFPFTLHPSRARTWAQIFVLAVLLAAPHALRSITGGWGLTLIAVVSSLVAAYVATFNLKKIV